LPELGASFVRLLESGRSDDPGLMAHVATISSALGMCEAAFVIPAGVFLVGITSAALPHGSPTSLDECHADYADFLASDSVFDRIRVAVRILLGR
jgi:hypothetical protein